MNKQQLASKIWESANRLRSKIEASEYKDYILGFIFYKFLSDKEERWCRSNGFTDEQLHSLTTGNDETQEQKMYREFIQNNIGYFIAYGNLYSTWLKMGVNFNVSNVTDALSAFGRDISPTYTKVFKNIFRTLETGITKLGESAAAQTRTIHSLLEIINEIPTDGRQDYDILGFIYEYLIGMFAANAGKKAGEFYTPHEVAQCMAEIVAEHLKSRPGIDTSQIDIYDPTSGSGSLLLNIGKAVARRIGKNDNIKYFAQEKIEATYNLTRMNLIMRGIEPGNIEVRNGDTLENDWPFFDESNPIETYRHHSVDAVVSNPPYSQSWDSTNKDNDPRFANFGIAPRGKADYAFLLHDLYHLKQDGIMTIVLPHGVLFRGNEEGQIRQKLIEENHIDAIIGLPANIFFGTGIPTIVMVLRKVRENTDILIVDASQGYAKDGTKNRLRASDIRRISDTVIQRLEIPGYSRRVSREVIRQNDYNLNIPRYIENQQCAEAWDIYSTMFGGIPVNEIDTMKNYFSVFSGLKDTLFTYNAHNAQLAVDNVHDAIFNHPSVRNFIQQFTAAFADFPEYLRERLIANTDEMPLLKEEDTITEHLFAQMKDIPLVDAYDAYQLLDEQWHIIAADVEIIQTDNDDPIRKIDPNMVIKKKDGKDMEVQDGWYGRIIPFQLVQETLLADKHNQLKKQEERLASIDSELASLIDSIAEEDKGCVLNDDNDAFVEKEVKNKLSELLADVDTPIIRALRNYLTLSKKKDKLNFIDEHTDVPWKEMQAGKDGTYGKTEVQKLIVKQQYSAEYPEESLEHILLQADRLMDEKKEIKADYKKQNEVLTKNTISTIEQLTEEQINQLLEAKWITPLMDKISRLPIDIVKILESSIQKLAEKYQTTLMDIEHDIAQEEQILSSMLNELTGSEEDLLGLQEFRKLLGDN